MVTVPQNSLCPFDCRLCGETVFNGSHPGIAIRVCLRCLMTARDSALEACRAAGDPDAALLSTAAERNEYLA